MSSTRYLEKHGRKWRVQVRVPPKLQSVLGKKRLVESLGTESLATANRDKWKVVERLKQKIEEAKKGNQPVKLDRETEAIGWRQMAELETAAIETLEMPDGRELTAKIYEIRDHLIPERAREISSESGEEDAELFLSVATGEATPIRTLFKNWAAERKDLKPKQVSDYERSINRFTNWLAERKLPTTIETTDRKRAGRFISEAMVAKERHPKTANKDISALSSYWKWLIKKGFADINPWAGQSLSKKAAPKLTKRPYTNEEVRKLVEGAGDAMLSDTIKVAALSGMRLSEIVSLKVADVKDRVFNIREAKTDAGVRMTLTCH